MNITVTTLDARRFSVRCDMPMDLLIGYLKDQIHAAEPRYTPFCQRILTGPNEYGRYREYMDMDPLVESEYLLVLYPDRVGVELVDYAGLYQTAEHRIFTQLFQASLPTSGEWEAWKARMDSDERVPHCDEVTCRKIYGVTRWGEKVLMECGYVRGAEDSSWKKQITLSFVVPPSDPVSVPVSS